MYGFERIIDQIRPYTMVDDRGLKFSFHAACDAVSSGRDGVIVECGTWLGGCAFGMALSQRERFGTVLKPVLMFDSFEGLPQPSPRDGPAANHYTTHPEDPGYLDNCKAPVDAVMRARSTLGLSDRECRLFKGWFSDTVEPARNEIVAMGGISVLRIDCDWYDPVLLVLNQFGALVAEGGVILLDDYYAWDGCARATHEWLARHDHPYRIRQGAAGLPWAWLEKRAAREFGSPL